MLRSAIAALALLLGLWTGGSAVAASDPTRIDLVDQRGAHFSLHALRGTPTILTFVASRCGDTCPMSDALFEHLAQTHVSARLVTITLDPGYDTPFVMAQYAHMLGADARSWRVASGAPAGVNALLDSLGVERPRVTTHEAPQVHSTMIYCLDRAGRLAKTVLLSDHAEADVRAWLRAIS
jgi:cytochrome oxidase Cu insertion factor (SCO1/SenC/PrrC family)